MFSEYAQILSEETELFKSAIALEKEKRSCILRVDGPKLQTLSRRTERVLADLERLRKKGRRVELEIIGKLSEEDPNLTLSRILELASEDARLELSRTIEEYRKNALTLKSETDENDHLLISAGQAINRMLESLKNLVLPDTEATYGPGGKDGQNKNRGPSRSVLLNANA